LKLGIISYKIFAVFLINNFFYDFPPHAVVGLFRKEEILLCSFLQMYPLIASSCTIEQ
jgi:hypothetical protein